MVCFAGFPQPSSQHWCDAKVARGKELIRYLLYIVNFKMRDQNMAIKNTWLTAANARFKRRHIFYLSNCVSVSKALGHGRLQLRSSRARSVGQETPAPKRSHSAMSTPVAENVLNASHHEPRQPRPRSRSFSSCCPTAGRFECESRASL